MGNSKGTMENMVRGMTDSKKYQWVKHLIGGGITLLCLLVFFKLVNLNDLKVALQKFHWGYLFLGLICLATGYTLRIIRWSIMLRTENEKVNFMNCSAPFLGSIALNNILPLRIGDIVRALVFPRSMGITKVAATSSLIVERLIDMLTLLASFAIGLFIVETNAIPEELKTTAITLALLGGVVLFCGLLLSKTLGVFFNSLSIKYSNTIRLSSICSSIAGLLKNFSEMSRPKILFKMLPLSMLVWVGEAGLFYFVMLGVGMQSFPAVALLVMSIATLSTLVPSSPGYVGPFHIAAFTAISLVGGTAAQGGSYAVIVHLALWLPTTIVGLITIWLNPELFKSTNLKKPNIELRGKNE